MSAVPRRIPSPPPVLLNTLDARITNEVTKAVMEGIYVQLAELQTEHANSADKAAVEQKISLLQQRL